MSQVTPEEGGISRDADAGQPKEKVATAVVVPMNAVPVVAEMSRGAGGGPPVMTDVHAIAESPEDLLASDGMVVKQNFKDICRVCLCQPNYQVGRVFLQPSDRNGPLVVSSSDGIARVRYSLLRWWCVCIVAVAIPVASYLSISTSPFSSRLHAQPPAHTRFLSFLHPTMYPTPCIALCSGRHPTSWKITPRP